MVTHDMLIAHGRLKPGEWLLITGASSGVGVASLQAGKALGANVIGTSGSAEKLAKLKQLGLDVGVVTRGGGFCEPAMQATADKGVDLVVNTVGGTVFAECVSTLAYQGRLATVGYLDRTLTATIDLEALHAKRLHLFGVSNKLRPAAERAQTVRAFEKDLLPYFADGQDRARHRSRLCVRRAGVRARVLRLERGGRQGRRANLTPHPRNRR